MKALAEWVKGQVEGRFPAFPVSVEAAEGDPNTLCVRVFAVPARLVEAVEDSIWSLEGCGPESADVVLMPLVKNARVTREYYPAKWAAAQLRAITWGFSGQAILRTSFSRGEGIALHLMGAALKPCAWSVGDAGRWTAHVATGFVEAKSGGHVPDEYGQQMLNAA